jgi:hypothetical protein
MPTITNYGDVIITGNTTGQGTGSSTFAGSLGCTSLTATNITASQIFGAGGFVPIVGGTTIGVTGNVYVSNTLQTTNIVASGNVNTSGTGVYQVAGTTVIDASRNLKNIGTVGSGAITSTSTVSGTTLTASTAHDTSGTGVYQVAGTTVIDASRNLTNIVGVSATSMTLGTALGITNGGTGATTAQAAINALAGATTNARFLRGNGTNVVMEAISASDVPTLNQSTTASAGSLSTTFTSGYVLYGQGTGVPAASSALSFDTGTSTLTATGDVVAYSDRNIKTNIEPIIDALSKVSSIGGYTFTRTDIPSGRRTGVIAQEVRDVLPEAVYETENGTLTVAYGNMVGLLIEAIKELQGTVQALKEEIQHLKK